MPRMKSVTVPAEKVVATRIDSATLMALRRVARKERKTVSTIVRELIEHLLSVQVPSRAVDETTGRPWT